MSHKLHYATVTEAIEALRKQGFTIDFNLEDSCLVYETSKLCTDDFEIVDVYRYEGDSDPGDEATVYGIASKNGIRGILVMGYGISAEGVSAEFLEKLKRS